MGATTVLEQRLLQPGSQLRSKQSLTLQTVLSFPTKEMVKKGQEVPTDLENELMVAAGEGQLGTLGRSCTHCYI